MQSIKGALNNISIIPEKYLKDEHNRFFIPNDLTSILQSDTRTYVLLPPKYSSILKLNNRKSHYFITEEGYNSSLETVACTLLSPQSGKIVSGSVVNVPQQIVASNVVKKGEAFSGVAAKFLNTYVTFKNSDNTVSYGLVTKCNWEQPTVFESLNSRVTLEVLTNQNTKTTIKALDVLSANVSELMFLLKPLENTTIYMTTSSIEEAHYELERGLTRDELPSDSFFGKYMKFSKSLDELLDVWQAQVRVVEEEEDDDDLLVLEEIVNAERLANQKPIWTTSTLKESFSEFSMNSNSEKNHLFTSYCVNGIKSALQLQKEHSTRLLTLEEKMQNVALHAQLSVADLNAVA